MFLLIELNKPLRLSHMDSMAPCEKRLGIEQESASNYLTAINYNYKPGTTAAIYNVLKHLLFLAAHREEISEREEEIAGDFCFLATASN